MVSRASKELASYSENFLAGWNGQLETQYVFRGIGYRAGQAARAKQDETDGARAARLDAALRRQAVDLAFAIPLNGATQRAREIYKFLKGEG